MYQFAKHDMSDIQYYAEKRARRYQAFAKNLETGYTEFKIGIILRQAREEAGLTQARSSAAVAYQ